MTAPHRLLDSVTKGDTLILTVLQPQIEGDQVASALKAELLNLVETSGLKKVILDLKNTRYVSSIAFWPLLALRKQLSQESGGRIIICGLHGAVEEVFRTTRMVSSSGATNAAFEMASDAETALALMAQG